MNQEAIRNEMSFCRESLSSDGGVADDESGSSPGRYSELDDTSYRASVIMVGSTKAGKTCLVRALTQQDFKKTYQETSVSHNRIDCEYVDPAALRIIYNSLFDQPKNNPTSERSNPKDSVLWIKNKKMENLCIDKVILEFIDISGAKDHTTERQIHSKNVDAIIFVYDISNPKSLEEIKNTFYYEACRIKCQTPLTTPHVLVGTKLDLFQQETEFNARDTAYVSQDKSMLYGSNFNCWSIQTSAKTGTGISDLRDYLLSLVISNTPRGGRKHNPTPPKKSILQKMFKCILQ